MFQNDSPPELGLPPDPILDESNMPELQHQGSSNTLMTTVVAGSSTATSSMSGAADNSVVGLASSFKDKVKIEKKHGSNENQPDQKKEVMVEVGGKKKPTGGKSNKKSLQAANLVCSTVYLRILKCFKAFFLPRICKGSLQE